MTRNEYAIVRGSRVLHLAAPQAAYTRCGRPLTTTHTRPDFPGAAYNLPPCERCIFLEKRFLDAKLQPKLL